PEIDGESLLKLLERVSALDKADILCLSGSVPKNCPEDIYSSMLEIAAQKGVKTVVDAEGKLLLNCLKYNPFLIKPNTAELEGIFETQIKSDDEIIKYAYELCKMGAENVVVSCGKDGAILVSKKGVYKALSPKGKAINTVGSGDSLVAGFIAEYQKSGNCEKALKLGVAAGSATAFSEKIAQKGEILSLIEKVEIEKIR
ncbi:MAG: bifunctional hydroxymethylpyrimidine kinase/phosphomethylpyrimidine kinase, partial [Clostridia bacterium]|nr:bifunctional hydroxymethylpyrimidine kinase/phosphomethylpyrimidine kinase [Clostridia bacterium]